MLIKKRYSSYDYDLIVILSNWFPLFGQGWYFGFGLAFVKYVYYRGTKEICWEETEDVIRHEYAHLILRKEMGFVKYWSRVMYDYLRFWIAHNKKIIEIEVNRIKDKLER